MSLTNFETTRMGLGFAQPPARDVLVQGVARTGTRCYRVWYKVWQGLVQGVIGFGTRCDSVWYKVWQGLVQGVIGFGTRRDKVWYKV